MYWQQKRLNGKMFLIAFGHHLVLLKVDEFHLRVILDKGEIASTLCM